MQIQKSTIYYFTLIIVLMFVAIPTISFAQGLVPCDGVGVDCDFNALMTLINKVIRFILLDLAIPIAAIMFVYAGFTMVTSGGSTESRTKAKSIFYNAVIGLVIAAAAWLIIRTILAILGFEGGWIFDNF